MVYRPVTAGKACKFRVRHALWHKDGGQNYAGDQVGTQPGLLVRASGGHARDPSANLGRYLLNQAALRPTWRLTGVWRCLVVYGLIQPPTILGSMLGAPSKVLTRWR